MGCSGGGRALAPYVPTSTLNRSMGVRHCDSREPQARLRWQWAENSVGAAEDSLKDATEVLGTTVAGQLVAGIHASACAHSLGGQGTLSNANPMLSLALHPSAGCRTQSRALTGL